MRLIERVISVISPKMAFKRQAYVEKSKMMSQAVGVIRGGGSYKGASGSSSMSGMNISSGNANTSVIPDLPELRDRSQYLFNNTPAASGAIKNINTNVVGTGLLMRSTPEMEFLGYTTEEIRAWSDTVEREFEFWSENAYSCDFNSQMTFKEIQKLICLSQQVSGDVFVLMPWVKRKNSIYDLKLQIIEAARVCNPDDSVDTKEIIGGIEYDEDGIPSAIHIRTPHPGDSLFVGIPTWERISIFGSKSGRRNVLHIMEHERIDQARGIPVLAPVIEIINQIATYSEAEIKAAVINAFFAVSIERPPESDDPDEMNDPVYDADNKKDWSDRGLKLKAGTIIEGAPGEKISPVNPVRPSSQFDPFFLATMKQIGMALEIPFEVLIKYFSSSYSAARAALLEANKLYRAKRSFIVNKFCKPVFEEFLTEAVIKGRINAPGYLEDPSIRFAYLKTAWSGPAPGQLDPTKELEASNMACKYGFSSRSKEAAELYGHDFEEIVREQAKDNRILNENGISLDSSIHQPIAENNNSNSSKEESV